MEPKLIVGLGNPGGQYELTRHNLGFMAVDQLAQEWAVEFKPSSFTKGVVAEYDLGEQKVYLLKPLTFMNKSGIAVKQLMAGLNIDSNNILVVCDDINLGFDRIRLRSNGSDGGNNGLNSVIYHLNTEDFARLRLGIGHPGIKDQVTDYVLEDFTKDEQSKLDEFVGQAVQCAKAWLTQEFDEVMQQFNGR